MLPLLAELLVYSSMAALGRAAVAAPRPLVFVKCWALSVASVPATTPSRFTYAVRSPLHLGASQPRPAASGRLLLRTDGGPESLHRVEPHDSRGSSITLPSSSPM